MFLTNPPRAKEKNHKIQYLQNALINSCSQDTKVAPRNEMYGIQLFSKVLRWIIILETWTTGQLEELLIARWTIEGYYYYLRHHLRSVKCRTRCLCKALNWRLCRGNFNNCRIWNSLVCSEQREFEFIINTMVFREGRKNDIKGLQMK